MITYRMFGDKKSGRTKYTIKDDMSKGSTNISELLDRFEFLVEGSELTDIFLIADLGVTKDKTFQYTSDDTGSMSFPFIRIAEYHFGGRLNLMNDNLSIISTGITQEFNDNKSAIEQFSKNINSKIPCSLVYKNKIIASSQTVFTSNEVLHRFRFKDYRV